MLHKSLFEKLATGKIFEWPATVFSHCGWLKIFFISTPRLMAQLLTGITVIC